MNPLSQYCPCCSGKSYEQCCQRLHKGALAKDALELMRSRYTAYALDLPDYIIATTHPASPQYSENKFAWKRSLQRFSRHTSFNRLEVLDFKERGIVATVTFTATLSEDDHDSTFTEKSYFEKIGDRWLYRVGQLREGHAPNLVTTGQLRIMPLAYYGDPVLKKKADPVSEISDDIKKLAEEMIETMDACNGAGLAAPQVHHSIRLFVIPMPVDREEEEPAEVKIFINPRLFDPSPKTWKVEEGCLSIPTIRAAVERPKAISVEYTNLEGEIITERFSGWDARAVMHENDHINGILFVDRIDAKERAKIAPILHQIENRIQDGRSL